MNNVVIDYPQRLEDEIEGFRLDAVDDEKNYTAARLRLCRDSKEGNPVLFYTQELSRNFKDPRDSFGKRHLIKVFTPGRFQAAADEVITGKFQDTLLAHKGKIPDYSPLSDIHSTRMNLFIDAPTAQFLEDEGVRIDGLSEDFEGIESVSATPFMDAVAHDASLIKRELAGLKGKLSFIKDDMADYLEGINVRQVGEDVFAESLARAPKVPADMVQSYLSIRERMSRLEGQLGHVQSTIFQETAPKIRLPRAIDALGANLAVAV
ncbi:MAG: hypothetical protein IIB42_05120 [Candidatus Marinimicrobia bacterium]|nr:hypothetical protein [Candidatus Neomarinimicrobiota bacterium]